MPVMGSGIFTCEIAKQALNKDYATVISTDLSAPNVTVVQSLLVTHVQIP